MRRSKSCVAVQIYLGISGWRERWICAGPFFNCECGRLFARFREGRPVATASWHAKWVSPIPHERWQEPARRTEWLLSCPAIGWLEPTAHSLDTGGGWNGNGNY